MSLLKKDIKRKRQIDKKTTEQLEFKAGGNNEKYEMGDICDSAVYARELEVGHLLGLYYLVTWKGYLEDESTWEFASAVQHPRKLVSIFHKNHPNKPTAIFLRIDIALPMAKRTALPNVNSKRKRG